MQYSFLESVDLSSSLGLLYLVIEFPTRSKNTGCTYEIYWFVLTEYIYVSRNYTVYSFVLEEYMHF